MIAISTSVEKIAVTGQLFHGDVWIHNVSSSVAVAIDCSHARVSPPVGTPSGSYDGSPLRLAFAGLFTLSGVATLTATIPESPGQTNSRLIHVFEAQDSLEPTVYEVLAEWNTSANERFLRKFHPTLRPLLELGRAALPAVCRYIERMDSQTLAYVAIREILGDLSVPESEKGVVRAINQRALLFCRESGITW